MDIAEMFGDAYRYTREAVWGKWERWILLIIATIIFPFIFGYVYRVLQGKKTPPDLSDGVGLFVDGVKVIVVGIIYFIPVWLVGLFILGGIVGPIVSALVGRDIGSLLSSLTNILSGVAIWIILTIIIEFIIYLVLIMAVTRMARTDSFVEAFNFGAIDQQIRSIGWGEYIVALLMLWVATILISAAFGAINLIPFIGWLIVLILYPAYFIYIARYVSLVYDGGAGTL
jgi:hypothetical protein